MTGDFMKLHFSALCLAVFGCAAGLVTPATAEAGNVGYYQWCGWGGSPAQAITLAGHTPVPLYTLDSASLQPLQGLVISTCSYPGSAAVDAAVANGLRLMLDTPIAPDPSLLPGSPALTMDMYGNCGDTSLYPGSPVTTGPGGTLTDRSLDRVEICGSMGSVAINSLPAGGRALVAREENPARAAAVAYPTGRGLVAMSVSQWPAVLPGAFYEGSMTPGVKTYYANTIAWMMGENVFSPATTCVSEGYTGTKLTWCQNICEKGYTGATLNLWIQRWVSKYRDLPYCAAEK